MVTELLDEHSLAKQLASFLHQENEIHENQEKLTELKNNRPTFEESELTWEELKIAADHDKAITELELLIVRQHEQLEKLEKEIAACIPNNIYGKCIIIKNLDQQGTHLLHNFRLTVFTDQEIEVALV